MGLLSFLQRPTDAPAAPDSRTVEDIRRMVRRRLIGAAALVMVAVVAFPLLFDAPPRPVAVDIAIEIPSRDTVAPLPAPRPASGVASTTPAATAHATGGVAAEAGDPAPARNAMPAAAPILTETAADAGREVAPPASPPASAAARSAAGAASAPPRAAMATTPTTPPAASDKPKAEAVKADPVRAEAQTPDGRAAPKPEARADAAAREKSASLEAARALAALEARPLPSTDSPAPASTPRFVVQVGAFSEVGPLRETRQKVEKLGLKTYTQVVDTADGPRTRVRVGPFGDRSEADRAAAQIRQAGLAPVVLSL